MSMKNMSDADFAERTRSNLIRASDMGRKESIPAGGPEKQVRNELDRSDNRQSRERIPFGVPQANLGATYDIPGFFLRWIDDIGGRLEKAVDGFYQFVTKNEVRLSSPNELNGDLGERVSKMVGTNRQTGQGYRSYLMKIPNELREEDKKILSDRRAKRAGAILHGSNDKNFYNPVKNSITSSDKFNP